MSLTVRRRMVSSVALMQAPVPVRSWRQSARRRRARPAAVPPGRADGRRPPLRLAAAGRRARRRRRRSRRGWCRSRTPSRPRRRRSRPAGRRPSGGACRRPGRASRSRRRTRPGPGRAEAARRSVRRPGRDPGRCGRSARTSGVGSSSRVRPSSRVSFVVGPDDRAEVGDRGGHDECVEAGWPVRRAHRGAQRRAELGRRARPRTTAASPGRATSTLAAMSVTRAPRARAASATADAHLAGRAVADEADGVDRLARPTGGHHDVPAGKVRIARPAATSGGRAAGSGARTGRPADGRDDGVDDGRQLGQPARRPSAPRRAARCRARRSV